MESKNDFIDLTSALDSLQMITDKLKYIAQSLVVATVINLIVTLLISMRITSLFESKLMEVNITLIPLICGLMVALLAFRFDSFRRDGDIYFEELSDELHANKLKSNSDRNELALKARIVIRRFTNAASLPLLPGKYGPALLLFINLLMSVWAAQFFQRLT
jgi:uncharacterized protein YacL